MFSVSGLMVRKSKWEGKIYGQFECVKYGGSETAQGSERQRQERRARQVFHVFHAS